MAELTDAESRALVWLCKYAIGHDQSLDALRLRGGDLIDYYYERWHERMDPQTSEFVGRSYTGGAPRTHSYRRQGGLILRRMADKGYLTQVACPHGVPEYGLTHAGKRHVMDRSVKQGT